MNIRFIILPKSALGWWSVGLFITWILFSIFSQVILGPGPDYNMILANALTIIAGCLAAAASVTGLVNIIKGDERGLLVIVAVAVSLYSLIGVIVTRP